MKKIYTNKKNFLFFLLVFLFYIFNLCGKTILSKRSPLFICNDGISFGLPVNQHALFLLTVLAIFLVSVLIVFFYKKCRQLSFILSIILIGITSNFSERLINGCVIDFIHISMQKDLYFNFSDIYITLGLFLIGVSWDKCAQTVRNK